MKKLLLLACMSPAILLAQEFSYGPTEENPFGSLNPNAPTQTADYAELIGSSRCRSVARVDQNTWADTVDMVWNFKYIMNGLAVQDESFKSDQQFSGSIRQYSEDSARWYVHYYSSVGAPSPVLPAWGGNREGDQFILYKEQTAPNGMEGFYKITFSNITEESFDWLGEWVNPTETFSYPTWRINCTKIE